MTASVMCMQLNPKGVLNLCSVPNWDRAVRVYNGILGRKVNIPADIEGQG